VTVRTIAIDSSAWVALAWQEPEAAAIAALIETSLCLTSAAVLLETHMVLRNRRHADPLVFVSKIMTLSKLDIVGIGKDHFTIARTAFDRYGKGQGHRAQLNFGDCLSYAVAKVAGVPLLFKGDDFRHTDIEPALRT
jgi:ribonuclease VapC